jgi:methyl-accepting chemotaxis protein
MGDSSSRSGIKMIQKNDSRLSLEVYKNQPRIKGARMLANMKVGKKLFLGFGVTVLLTLAISFFALMHIMQIDHAVNVQNDLHMQKLEPLYVAREALDQTGIAARNAYIFTDDADAGRELDLLDKERTIYVNALKEMTPLFAGDPQFEKMSASLHAMAQELDRPRRYRESGDMEGYGKFLVNECSPLRRQIVEDIGVLLKSVQHEVDLQSAEAERATEESKVFIPLAAAIVLLLSIGLGFFITRSITRPLNEAVHVAQTVAAGDLTSRIESKARDETGQLLQALKNMNESLVRIVGDVHEGTAAIAAASDQIATGNMDLSGRTEEQASSLEETASSMEELTSTVRQNADNARQANSLSLSASQVAVKGGEVMGQVVTTMSDINDSAHKIADIIGVIDGIAFQTNILALNAAVEAARAGEQGRGFAVVASEVRSLAQRSATAAKEIKTLIDDSVGKVETGSKLVTQAGDTMTEVVNSVKRVTDIVAEISAASEEQSSGIEQVNNAIAQMDQVTQQNAALVEQAAAAAGSLNDQAARLERTVGVFKLHDAAGAKRQDIALAVARSTAKPAVAPRRIAPAAAPRVALAAGGDWEEF